VKKYLQHPNESLGRVRVMLSIFFYVLIFPPQLLVVCSATKAEEERVKALSAQPLFPSVGKKRASEKGGE